MSKREKIMEIISGGWLINNKYPVWAERKADKILELDEVLSFREIKEVVFNELTPFEDNEERTDDFKFDGRAINIFSHNIAKSLVGKIKKEQDGLSEVDILDAIESLDTHNCWGDEYKTNLARAISGKIAKP